MTQTTKGTSAPHDFAINPENGRTQIVPGGRSATHPCNETNEPCDFEALYYAADARAQRLSAEKAALIAALDALISYAERGDITGRGRTIHQVAQDARATLAKISV